MAPQGGVQQGSSDANKNAKICKKYAKKVQIFKVFDYGKKMQPCKFPPGFRGQGTDQRREKPDGGGVRQTEARPELVPMRVTPSSMYRWASAAVFTPPAALRRRPLPATPASPRSERPQRASHEGGGGVGTARRSPARARKRTEFEYARSDAAVYCGYKWFFFEVNSWANKTQAAEVFCFKCIQNVFGSSLPRVQERSANLWMIQGV